MRRPPDTVEVCPGAARSWGAGQEPPTRTRYAARARVTGS